MKESEKKVEPVKQTPTAAVRSPASPGESKITETF